MRKTASVPIRVAARSRHRVRHAVRTRRVGNLPADYGLDVLNFFLADVQTGFGPFIAVYLTANGWQAASFGTALGIGTIVSMAAQIPAGAVIDAIPLKRGAALLALVAVLASAVMLALLPYWLPVLSAEVLHGLASCLLGPAIAAVTLSRVGHAALPQRLGRNARFMALGNGIGAVLMGLAGAYVSLAAPFWLTALSTLPAIAALTTLPPRHESEPRPQRLTLRKASAEGWRIAHDWRLLRFIVCVTLFHAGNAFILPLAMSRLTTSIGSGSTNQILAGCLLVAQGVVAIFAPLLGRKADQWGRRPVLLIGFAAVPLHAALLACFGSTYAVIGLQLLDGVGAAMFGVLQPLIAADVTRGTNRFNLSLGVLGLAAGLGGTFSNIAGGFVVSHYGDRTGFLALAGLGLLAIAAVYFLMPETRARRDAVRPGRTMQDPDPESDQDGQGEGKGDGQEGDHGPSHPAHFVKHEAALSDAARRSRARRAIPKPDAPKDDILAKDESKHG